jgi:hypothetical protein
MNESDVSYRIFLRRRYFALTESVGGKIDLGKYHSKEDK